MASYIAAARKSTPRSPQHDGSVDVDAFAVASEVGKTLEYAHSQRIVHLNIRPTNSIVGTTPEGLPVMVKDRGTERGSQSSTVDARLIHIKFGEKRGSAGHEGDEFWKSFVLFVLNPNKKLPSRGTLACPLEWDKNTIVAQRAKSVWSNISMGDIRTQRRSCVKRGREAI